MRLLVLGCLTVFSACPAKTPTIIDSFTATPSTIDRGESSLLAWKAHGGQGCSLNGAAVPFEGSLTVTPEATTTYTLACAERTSVIVLTVRIKAHISSFTTSDPTIILDGFATLTWVTEGTDHCVIGPAPTTRVQPSGSLQVTPKVSTVYTLDCDGYQGPVHAEVAVGVSHDPQLATPSGLVLVGGDGSLTATWSQDPGASNLYLAAQPDFDASTVSSKLEGAVYSKVHAPFVITGLTNGTTYFARVSAVSGTLESALSPQASGTPVEGPMLSDPLFPAQWHLSSSNGEDIHAPAAWALAPHARGEGIKVAVVDEGVDLAHEDLHLNVATGLSYDYLGTTALGLAQHGTCVAGLVSARDFNGLGVRGVAPRSSFVSYNVLQDLTSANQYDAMTRNEAVISVSNNSWGDADDGTGYLTESDPLWLAGVQEGTVKGRHGLGTVYFWAAGNGADSQYLDNSNYDGQANRRYVFAISGVGPDGVAPGYSEAGANILVAAPTEGNLGPALTTTDITGTLGYNSGTTPGELSNANYSQTMSGTSGSTPIAAGVGALVLQARPELSWRDVRRVLAYSARKNDPSDPDWAVNGAGLHINHRYGFGVVDAQRAITEALTITPATRELISSTPKALLNLPIPDNDATGVSSTITVAGSGLTAIEFVEIYVDVTHPRTGDLSITVQKVGGATDVLHVPHSCQPDRVTHQEVCSPINDYPFGSTRHLDEPADGDWVITVRDVTAGNTGTFVGWHLTISGH